MFAMITMRMDNVADMAKLDYLIQLVEDIHRRLEQQPQAPLRRRVSERSNPSTAEYRAGSFVESQLRRDGPLGWDELTARGARYNHAARTMVRGRKRVATCRRVGGRWLWHLRPELVVANAHDGADDMVDRGKGERA